MKNVALCFLIVTSLSAESAFVTADVLLIRQGPGKSTKVIGMLPYGTLISVSSSAPTLVDGYEWLFSDTANGFVAKAFLSSVKPAQRKVMTLTSIHETRSCFAGPAWNSWATLRLSNGLFDYFAYGTGGGMAMEIRGSGSYAALPTGLRLQFSAIAEKRGGVDLQTASTQPSFELDFDSKIGGFVLNRPLAKDTPLHIFPVISKSQLPKGSVPETDRRNCAILLEVCPTVRTVANGNANSVTSGYLCPSSGIQIYFTNYRSSLHQPSIG